MCKSPRAVHVNGKMPHLQVFGNVDYYELHKFLFLKSNASFHLSDLYLVS